jgi:TonB-linked SusC/RagA family outer membrane protein
MQIRLLCLALVLALSAGGQKISLSFKNMPLESVFREIEKKTPYRFVYTREDLGASHSVSLELRSAALETALQRLFEGQPLSYSLHENYISVSRKDPQTVSAAKTMELRGRVFNEKGEPVSGASVSLRDGSRATATDEKGSFSLSGVPEEAVLIITSIGYYREEIPLHGRSSIDVRLTTFVNPLDQTILIAYGTTSKKLNTGNISKVSKEQIETQPVSNPLQALSGRVPGLYIQQSSGAPGGGITVQIRGQNSLRNFSGDNGNLPLYIIDGLPYPSATLTSVYTSSSNLFGGNPLSSINPLDIESIEVLKDADATAIYGSRGANGVVLITTKKARMGKTRFDASYYQGWARVGHRMDLLSSRDYLTMRRISKLNDGQPIFSYDFDINGAWDTTRYTDWQKVLIGGTAHYTDAQASVSGGNASTQFLFGGGYHRETTVFPGDFSDQKGSFHFQLGHYSEDRKFSSSLSASYYSEDNRLLRFDPTQQAVKLSPVAPAIYNADGSLNWQNSTWDNPFAELLKTYHGTTGNLLASMDLGYRLAPGLQLKASAGYLSIQVREKDQYPISAQNPAFAAYGLYGAASFARSNTTTWNLEPQLEWQKNILRGNLKILVGTTLQQSLRQSEALHGEGYTSDALLGNLSSAPSLYINTSDETTYRYNALFGRLSYQFREKYLLNLTGRRDGSSRFGTGRQFANFGAAGVGWIFSKEKLLSTQRSFLSFGKLRASYGLTGSDQIADYGYLDSYSSTDYPYGGVSGLTPTRIANPDYGWEKTKKLEAALELGFLKDHIYLSLAYYRNLSSSQLVGYPLAGITGFPDVQFNLPATVRNSGLEIELSSEILRGAGLRWTSSLNLSIPRNKLLSFPGIAASSYSSRYFVGRSLFAQNLYHFLGVDPQTGVYMFEDLDKDSKLSYPNDLRPLKDVGQKYFGGFQNSFAYKNFRLEVLLQFVRQDGYNYLRQFGRPGTVYSNEPTLALRAWQKPGDQSGIQKYSENFSSPAAKAYTTLLSSDAAISDASFIRLKNLSLSWNLPTRWLKNMRSEGARVFAEGQNLVTWTRFLGMDPENQNAQILPPLRAIALGIHFSF